MNELIAKLKSEPALAWKVKVNIYGENSASDRAKQAAEITCNSALVQTLLAGKDASGKSYRKWIGSHWILAILADLGYPPGDETLFPLMEETFNTWLGAGHDKHIRLINGRTRRCASQEGYAAWSSMKLGFADARTDELIARLMRWQWPDGGWNCDKRPEVNISSFMETLIPLRALGLYAHISGDSKVKTASERAAEVFLKRSLFKTQRDGSVIDEHFVLLHYPAYWHYDILFSLKVLAEAGFISDPRCQAALDLLETKCLPDGSFPAEESFSRTTRPQLSGYTPVDWGGIRRKEGNPFVTADALYVLRAAGRLLPESLPEL
jgi:hypothetical protein